MRRLPGFPIACNLALGACAAGGIPSMDLAARLAAAPPGATARLSIDGSRIVAAAVPIERHDVPVVVRTMFDAIAPDGDVRFVGRETGPRGEGYRLETTYGAPPTERHTRSVLVDGDGAVLERAHSVPIARVPQHVLAAALRAGPSIEEAFIVSGAAAEEHWMLIVRDRDARTFVVDVSLDGTELARLRRVAAQVDV